MTPPLYCRQYPAAANAPSLLLLHGLFGSSANWHPIARRLQASFHVLSPDLRNHGRSPHDPLMSYPAMAGDILDLLDAQGLDRVDLVGHSMGGKVAMWLALHHPERVNRLVPVDMAPVKYPHRFENIFTALETLPLQHLASRSAADAWLARTLDSAGLRAFLLQNLLKHGEIWRWRINLRVLRGAIETLLDFPEETHGRQFPGETLFIYGGRSDYMNQRRAEQARLYFPFARLRMIPEAGHWVYAEAPEAFFSALSRFLTC